MTEYHRCPGCGLVNTGPINRKKGQGTCPECKLDLDPCTSEQLDRYHKLTRDNEQLRAALTDLLQEHRPDCELCKRASDETVPECRVEAYANLVRQ